MGFRLKKIGFLLVALPCLFCKVTLASNQYSITGMRPEGISQYSAPERGAHREYFHFKNEVGDHRFIYEEATSTTPLAGVLGLRQAIGNPEMVCSIDLTCRVQAFCTGKCQNMYYEMSNTPEDPALKERNHCDITAFKCQKRASGGASHGR